MKKVVLFLLTIIVQKAIAQNVGIGTTSPLTRLHVRNGVSGGTPFAFSPLTVENNDHTYINLLSPNSNETGILFGKTENAASGGIIYNHSLTPNGFHFRTNGNLTRMIINQFGLVGINTTNPQAYLHVNGDARIEFGTSVQNLTIRNGGNTGDFLVKQNTSGAITHRKGHAGVGIQYMIALEGNFPAQGGSFVNGTYIGEIRLFSGTAAPKGWAFCEGQLLPIAGNNTLFAIIGTIYGGDGATTFALPDLRDRVPVGKGNNWQLGEPSN